MSEGLTIGANIVTALASVLAVAIAIAAFRLAALTFKRDHRPLVRVVATLAPAAPGYEAPPQNMLFDKILLKNIGKGPGLTGVVYRPSNQTLIGDIEAIEPLGDADEEPNRPGRVVLKLRELMVMHETYELYYQDIVGAWHLTLFRPVPYKIECTFKGEQSSRKVPAPVNVIATVARP